MELRSQSLGPIITWTIRFASNWIAPLTNWLHRMAQEYAAQALESYTRGELAPAAVDYEEAIVWNPHDPKLHSALGQVYYEHDKLDEAEKQFRKALVYDYQNLRALKGLGLLRQEKHDLVEAMYLYLRYLELEPNDAVVCHNLGATFHNLGSYEEALEYYGRAETRDPDDPLIRKNRSLTLFAPGERYAEARDTLLHARELAPEDAEVDRLLGAALDAIGESDRALEYYASALKKDPMDADAHFRFGILAARLNRYPEAAQHAKVAADLLRHAGDVDGASQACWDLGWDYYKLGDLNSSLSASTEALQLNPKLAPVYFNIGLVLLQLGRAAEARKRYDDGIQKLAQLSDLKYYAIDDLREALAGNPKLAGASEILAMLEEKYAVDSRGIAKAADQQSV